MHNVIKAKSPLPIKVPPSLSKDPVACHINALRILLHMSGYQFPETKLKEIFEYDHEGAFIEQALFRKLNAALNDAKIPYKVTKQDFRSTQDVCKQVNKLPVPIYFQAHILHIIKQHLSSSINIGEITGNNAHVLLLVGYDQHNLLFFDPNYQLPWMANCKPIPISRPVFTEHHINVYIRWQHDIHAEKRFLKKKNPQKRLT